MTTFKQDFGLLKLAAHKAQMWHNYQVTLGGLFKDEVRAECNVIMEQLLPTLKKAIHHAYHHQGFAVEFKQTRSILRGCPHAAEVCSPFLIRVEPKTCATIHLTPKKTSRRSSSLR